MSEWTKNYAKELTAQMTLEEKMSQLVYQSPAIERLGIPAYNWNGLACLPTITGTRRFTV